MALLPVLAFRNQLPQIVVDELEQLVASINVVLETSITDTDALEQALEDLQDVVDDILATRTHNLLSDRHPDTIPDDPTPGALVVGTPQDVETDLSPYWYDGLEISPIPSVLDPGDETYWYDGLPIEGALGGLNSDVKWEKRDKGSTVGMVWTTTPEGADWQLPDTAGGVGVHAYATVNQAIAFETETPIPFGAVADDGGGFWSVGDPTVLTVPSSGKYVVVGQAKWQDSTGAFAVRLLVNGVEQAASFQSNTVSPAFDAAHQVTARLNLTAGDEVQLAVYWSFSDMTARTVLSGQFSSFLQMVKV